MTKKPDLYLCHTAYQVLIALIRAVRADGAQVLILSAAIPNAESLAERLTVSNAFSAVHVVDESACPGLASPGPLRHWRNRRLFEKKCGLCLHHIQYGDIYICNDWSVLGRYLQDCRAPYILCEDTVGGTLDPDQHLLDAQRAAPDFARRQKRGTDWLYWGDSRWVRAVESEDAARCTIFPQNRLLSFSKLALLGSLSEEEKAAVREVFLSQPLPSLPTDKAGVAQATLLLPRSFAADGLMTQAEQDAMFEAVARKYADGPLFLKTHPRDTTDYAALFPHAVILDRLMPSEVLNFCLPFRFRRAVTVQSWVLRGFTAAKETVFLTLDEAEALV
jgi:hypothetical protein